jgi:myo-inositol-1(or 4)-monophosphatase
MTFKQTALKAAKEAGKIQLRYFGKNIEKKTKKDNSYFTKADIESTNKIRAIIGKQYPKHNIICEELGSSNKKSDYRWIIDPLDGTHNFIMDNPLFGVSIALEHKKEIILGVIYMPFLKKLYYAKKGKGAFCNGKRIQVNNETKLKKCLLIYDAKLRTQTDTKIRILKKLAKLTWRFRVFGVAVYNNILVAEGKAGINIDFDSNSWDHAATLLLVEEAGGKVTDLNGKRWTTNIKDYVASNGKVHNKLLRLIK